MAALMLGIVANAQGHRGSWQDRPQRERPDEATMIQERTDRMAEKLRIKKKWKLFQLLWGIPNLGQLAGTWQQTGKLPPRSSEIDKLLK